MEFDKTGVLIPPNYLGTVDDSNTFQEGKQNKIMIILTNLPSFRNWDRSGKIEDRFNFSGSRTYNLSSGRLAFREWQGSVLTKNII